MAQNVEREDPRISLQEDGIVVRAAQCGMPSYVYHLLESEDCRHAACYCPHEEAESDQETSIFPTASLKLKLQLFALFASNQKLGIIRGSLGTHFQFAHFYHSTSPSSSTLD